MSLASALRGYLPDNQINFLVEVMSALEKIPTNDSGISVNECPPHILRKIMLVAENTGLIIDLLKSVSTARLGLLNDFPAWDEKWRSFIEKLREIAKALESDTFNCNISRLVAYLTSLTGDILMLASVILIPVTGGLSVPLGIAGGTMIAAGSITSFGTSVTENQRQKSGIGEAKDIINESQNMFEGMNSWVEHTTKLKKAQSEILELDIVKDVIPAINKLVVTGIKIENADDRSNYIEKKVTEIIECLGNILEGKIPLIGIKTLVTMLIETVVLLSNAESRNVFDCASLTLKSLAAVIVLLDEIPGLAVSVIPSASIKAARVGTRSTLVAISMLLDIVGVIKTSIHIHKGSYSSHAKKIYDVVDEMEKEAEIMRNVYNNVVQLGATS